MGSMLKCRIKDGKRTRYSVFSSPPPRPTGAPVITLVAASEALAEPMSSAGETTLLLRVDTCTTACAEHEVDAMSWSDPREERRFLISCIVRCSLMCTFRR